MRLWWNGRHAALRSLSSKEGGSSSLLSRTIFIKNFLKMNIGQSEKDKFFIKTYGCQMNVYDSEKITGIMNSMDYDQTESFEDAGVVIINTCHIRDKATEKMYSELGRIKEAKERRKLENKNTIIAVTGCVAQAEGEEIFSRSPFVDIVIGPESYHNLGKMIKDIRSGKDKLLDLDFRPNQKFDFLEQENIVQVVGSPSAFLTIQEGCDKFCSFCVVPYTRGAEFSRKVESIIDEAKKMIDKGTREIVLLGQNVNAFHGTDSKGKTWGLAQLILKLGEIEGLDRIRYTTSHPNDMTDDLIAVHGYEKKLMPILNLPVQSGSNKILKAMNRKHTREYYIELMSKLKKIRPELIFSSDFIIGFPGETDQDFNDTIDLIKEVGFCSQSFSFKYSPRPGTPAADKDQIDEAVKSERLSILQDLLEVQRNEFNQAMLGKTIPVLFDNSNMRKPNQIGGRSEFLQITICDIPQDGKAKVYGNITNVKITEVNNNSLFGVLV